MLKYSSMRSVRQAGTVKKSASKIDEAATKKASFVLVNSVQTLRLTEATIRDTLRQMQANYQDDTYNLAALAADLHKVISDIAKTFPEEVLKNDLEFEETHLHRHGDEPPF